MLLLGGEWQGPCWTDKQEEGGPIRHATVGKVRTPHHPGHWAPPPGSPPRCTCQAAVGAGVATGRRRTALPGGDGGPGQEGLETTLLLIILLLLLKLLILLLPVDLLLLLIPALLPVLLFHRRLLAAAAGAGRVLALRRHTPAARGASFDVILQACIRLSCEQAELLLLLLMPLPLHCPLLLTL